MPEGERPSNAPPLTLRELRASLRDLDADTPVYLLKETPAGRLRVRRHSAAPGRSVGLQRVRLTRGGADQPQRQPACAGDRASAARLHQLPGRPVPHVRPRGGGPAFPLGRNDSGRRQRQDAVPAAAGGPARMSIPASESYIVSKEHSVMVWFPLTSLASTSKT